MHVSGEKGGAHFLECRSHVFLGEFANTAKIPERAAEFVSERFEHAKSEMKRVSGKDSIGVNEEISECEMTSNLERQGLSRNQETRNKGSNRVNSEARKPGSRER